MKPLSPTILTILTYCCILHTVLCAVPQDELQQFIAGRSYLINGVNYTVNDHFFPNNFLFGYATAAYQHEGAWNLDGKGPSIWDYDLHTYPEHAADRTNGDVASDMYHHYVEDIQLIKNTGANAFRFSISWSRILPTGFPDQINQAGINWYKDFIKRIKAAGMEPLPTMYHWDLPQALQDYGGWTNQSVVNLFSQYADILFENFGDDIKYWVTHNEPQQTCEKGYGIGGVPPNIASSGILSYVCAHNVLLSHGEAYRVYKSKYFDRQRGKISMVIDSDWYLPASGSANDLEASERGLLFTYGWFGHPIFFGDYPDIMKSRIQERSIKEGYPTSRLPEFTTDQKEMLKGSADFLCINMYTTALTTWVPDVPVGDVNRNNDMGVWLTWPSDWEPTPADMIKVYPAGARSLLQWLSNTYNHPEILITENGYFHDMPGMNDLYTRGRYHKLYMSNVLDAIKYDNVNVIGYMAWSVMDCNNFYAGFLQGTSFYYVDFNDPNRARIPRDSLPYYEHICNSRCLIDQCVN